MDVPARDGSVDFLAGGGQMGARIRAFDWTATPLGPPSSWSAALRTVLRILLTTGHPVFVFWGPQHICFYNDAYSRSLGPEKHPSILGARGRDAWPEIWSIIGPQIDQVLAGGNATWHENQLVPIHRHGRVDEVYWTYSYGPIDDSSAPGGIGGVLVLCTETTPQVVAERRLREAEHAARLERDTLTDVLDGLPVLVTRYDAAVTRVWLNRQFTATLGWDERDAAAGRLMELCYPDPAVRERAATFMAGPPGQWRVIPTQARDGRTRRIAWTNLRLPNASQVGVGVDLSERLDAEDQLAAANARLREADRRKDDFLAVLAHELRGPLAPLQAAAAMLARRDLSGARWDQVAGIVARQVEAMSRLLGELSDVTRIVNGKLDLALALVDLRSPIQRAVEIVAPLAERKRQTVAVEYRELPPPTWLDGPRITQIVSNLLTNASKYTPTEGRVDVVVRFENREFVVDVVDSGIGLEPHQLDTVFEPFAQTDAARRFAPGGLGLGLPLARSLAHLHGGSLHASSPGPGKGSTFTLRIPLRESPVAPDAGAPGPLRGVRVLIADDNTDVARALANAAQRAGADVEVVYDAAGMFERERVFEPDAVVLHADMPGFDVRGAGRSIVERGRAVRIIAVSARPPPDEAEIGGMFDAWLSKPIDGERLIRAIAGPSSVPATRTQRARE